MTTPAERPKLPPEVEENVVEVTPGHVFLVFGGLLAGLLLTGGAVVVLKDWVRYKRHKALLELAARLIETIKNQKGDLYKWKKEATDTLSAMKN